MHNYNSDQKVFDVAEKSKAVAHNDIVTGIKYQFRITDKSNNACFTFGKQTHTKSL